MGKALIINKEAVFMHTKAREDSIRNKLSKLGYLLRKSRINNINLDNFGGYMILDACNGCVVDGSRYDLDLDDVDEFTNR